MAGPVYDDAETARLDAADASANPSAGGMFSSSGFLQLLGRGIDDFSKRKKADKINRFEAAAGQFGKSDTLAKQQQGVGGFNPLAMLTEQNLRKELAEDRDLRNAYIRQQMQKGNLKNVAEKSGAITPDKENKFDMAKDLKLELSPEFQPSQSSDDEFDYNKAYGG